MFKYLCLNPISTVGTEKFSKTYEQTDNIAEADGILVRSAAMHDMELPENLLAVARAGAGVNNIPLDKCAEKGIVVFNTPGANANGVKELVIAGMLLASRDVVGGIEWVLANQDKEDIAKAAEMQKRILRERKSGIKNLELSDWAQLALKWLMWQNISVWKCMDMTLMFPSMRHGI